MVATQGNGFPLEAGFVGRVPFTTTRAGALDATVDWTFATNDLDVALTRGDCSFEQFEAQQCTIAAFSISATAKPEKIRVDGAAAGAYTLFVENTGPGDESVSFQVVLTPSATGTAPPSASARQPQSMSLARKRPARGFVELR